eukprot:m.124504 g.124504  ORF g.124504 m.124504 type:complete len:479 (-) comp16294_c0_seq1:2080-3516(-)
MRLLLVAVLASCALCTASALRAGTAVVDATPFIGVPLAGFNHGPRRVPDWPVPKLGNYTTFMMPSVGVLNPIHAKALVLQENDGLFAMVSIDAIGADGTLRQMSLERIVAAGVPLPDAHFTVHGSHSHSGPGAISPNFLWQMAPATDLLVPEVQEKMAADIAQAVVTAYYGLQDAVLGAGSGQLFNVTTNRRAGISPYLKPDSVDTNLGIIRVDTPDGKPIATVWNFAMHGVCWGPEQMMFSSDIMGGVSDYVESSVGGVALFINGDAGDIDPKPQMCQGKPQYAGASIIGTKIAQVRSSIQTSDQVVLQGFSQVVPFGKTNLNYTLQRFNNCSTGGPMDICTICRILHCDVNLHLNSAWMEENPVFSALRLSVTSGSTTVHTLLVTMPGEPLFELGNQVRNDSKALGFDVVLLAGYSNGHMGYFATPDEYDVGGYESQLTLWGIQTSDLVRTAARHTAQAVQPARRKHRENKAAGQK